MVPDVRPGELDRDGRAWVRERIQFLVDPADKDRYERMALAGGRSLSEWLRQAADAAADQDPDRRELASRSGLEAFFKRCNEFSERYAARRQHGRKEGLS